MPDYETMYKKLFNSVTDAIEMLQEAQKKAEEKYGTLIITSLNFLELYEKFKNDEITTGEIKNRFKDEIGLFKP